MCSRNSVLLVKGMVRFKSDNFSLLDDEGELLCVASNDIVDKSTTSDIV